MFKFKAEPYYLAKVEDKEYWFKADGTFETEDSSIAKALRLDLNVQEEGKVKEAPQTPAGGEGDKEKALDKMNKAELTALAKELGIELAPTATNAIIAELIAAKKAELIAAKTPANGEGSNQ